MMTKLSPSRAGLLPVAAGLTLAATPASAASLDLSWIADLAVPYVETLAITAAAALVGWLASRLGRWIGVEIDRDHAEALHGAVSRGIRYAVAHLRSRLGDLERVDVESRVIAETAIYLEQTMPDALRHFGLTDDALDRLIRAHLDPGLLAWLGEMPTRQSGSAEAL